MIQDMVKIAVKALDSKKGVDIKVIKIDKLTTLADYFVICTGTSSTHVKALADECEYALTSAGYQPHHTEGFGSNSWILLDFKDLIVHVYDQAGARVLRPGTVLERRHGDRRERISGG